MGTIVYTNQRKLHKKNDGILPKRVLFPHANFRTSAKCLLHKLQEIFFSFLKGKLQENTTKKKKKKQKLN